MFKKVLEAKYLPFFALIVLAAVILWPSFDIALTGDDYLGFWRLQYTIRQGGTYFGHFFTDYGPQDILTGLVHSFFGFNSKVYYFLAFLLRILTAFSLYPLTFFLIGNKKSAFFSSIFFTLTATGMEILDWSFNMPSYLGITFMNISIFYLLKNFSEKQLKYFIFSLTFFLTAIISQPLRLLILPVIILGILFFKFISGKEFRLKSLLFSVIYLACFMLLYVNTDYGGVSGVKNTNPNGNLFSNTIQNVKQSLSLSGSQIFLSPISQIGNIVFPSDPLPEKITSSTFLQSDLFLVISFLIFIITLKYFDKTKKIRIIYRLIILLGLAWVYTIRIIIKPQVGITLIPPNYIGYLVGGFFLITILYLFILFRKNSGLRLGIFISLLIITTPILPIWIRNPGIIVATSSRYLIVSSAGVSLLAGLSLHYFRKKTLVISGIIIFLLINIFVIRKYLIHLHATRNIKLADSIRSSLTYKTEWKDKTPTMIFFLETDNTDIFYHSLYFGFPFFINYYKGELENPWNIAYTTDWNEIESAHLDGKALIRFGIVDTSPLPTENIYSYKIEFGKLINTTSITRNKLTVSNQSIY